MRLPRTRPRSFTPVGGEPLVNQAGAPRLARVESLRALAVLGVAVAHALYWSSTPPSAGNPIERTLVLTTQAGPFVLFVLSGCLLYGPFARRDLGSGGALSLRRYAVNRAVRILPVYYAALVAALLLAGGGTWREWLLYATFSQNLVIAPNDQVNRVMWFMVVEVHFYLVLPLLAFLVGRVARGSQPRALAALAGLGLASFGLFHYAWQLDPSPRSALQFSLPSTFFFLAAGMALAVLRVGWSDRRPAWLRGPLARTDGWILTAAALLGVLVAGRIQIPSTGAMVLILGVSVLLVGACVLPLQPGPLVALLQARPLAVVGVASYSLLLWHDPVLAALAGTSWAPGWPVLLAVGLPLSGLIAFGSYLLIEAPFLRLRQQWTSSSVAAAAPATSRAPIRRSRSARPELIPHLQEEHP